MQERRGERSRTICSCIHLDTRRNYNREFKLEFSWLQEQTLRLAQCGAPATAVAGIL